MSRVEENKEVLEKVKELNNILIMRREDADSLTVTNTYLGDLVLIFCDISASLAVIADNMKGGTK